MALQHRELEHRFFAQLKARLQNAVPVFDSLEAAGAQVRESVDACFDPFAVNKWRPVGFEMQRAVEEVCKSALLPIDYLNMPPYCFKADECDSEEGGEIYQNKTTIKQACIWIAKQQPWLVLKRERVVGPYRIDAYLHSIRNVDTGLHIEFDEAHHKYRSAFDDKREALIAKLTRHKVSMVRVNEDHSFEQAMKLISPHLGHMLLAR